MLSIFQELEKKNQWSRSDITNLLKNAAAQRAASTQMERAFLIKELALVDGAL